MRYEWIPCKRVGQLTLGSPIEPYVADGTLISMPYECPIGPPDDWDRIVYRDENESTGDLVEEIVVFAEDGLIVDVRCNRRCELRGRKLIGLDYETVREWIGSEPDGDADILDLGALDLSDEVQEQYYFEEVDASVWVVEGIVKLIDCGGGNEEDSAGDAG